MFLSTSGIYEKLLPTQVLLFEIIRTAIASFTPFIDLLVYSQLIILEVSELIFPHLFAVRLGSKDRFIKR